MTTNPKRYQVDKSDKGFYIMDTFKNEPVISFEEQSDCQIVCDNLNKAEGF